jgi:hypothetical protein
MRNTAPINHFPPTLFSPNRSPIYGEAHFFAAMSSMLFIQVAFAAATSGAVSCS